MLRAVRVEVSSLSTAWFVACKMVEARGRRNEGTQPEGFTVPGEGMKQEIQGGSRKQEEEALKWERRKSGCFRCPHLALIKVVRWCAWLYSCLH